MKEKLRRTVAICDSKIRIQTDSEAANERASNGYQVEWPFAHEFHRAHHKDGRHETNKTGQRLIGNDSSSQCATILNALKTEKYMYICPASVHWHTVGLQYQHQIRSH